MVLNFLYFDCVTLCTSDIESGKCSYKNCKKERKMETILFHTSIKQGYLCITLNHKFEIWTQICKMTRNLTYNLF